MTALCTSNRGVPSFRRTGGALALVLSLACLALSSRVHALDAGPWERVLRVHARNGGMDYRGLRADATARADLDRFVASLATMPESEGLASWLNAYNALVVKAIVDHLPIDSVKSVPHFFDGITYRVAGRDRTLDAIENDVVRPRFHDARVHVALVCGAVSCPNLYPHAFDERTLSGTLDALARATVASDAHVKVRGHRVEVSEIFFWFASDFERDAGSVLAWLERYDAGRRLASIPDGTTLGRIPYRWSLNQR